MNVLFIGNSYTYYNNMPEIFENLANINDKNVRVFSVTCGGHKLYEYIQNNDEYTKQIDELIKNFKFDICILQENSLLPITDYNMFISGLKQLTDKLKDCVDNFILYQTWGRKEGSKTLTEYSLTNKQMTFELASAYKKASDIINAMVSCVGINFYNVYTRHDEIELYDKDLTHPSYKGSCLAALTHYKTIFGDLPKNTDILSLTDDELRIFKNTVLKKQKSELFHINSST